MSSSPWLSIVLLGVAIVGYAWMIPKNNGKNKEPEFVSEAAYDRLLEDLESENRELLDAVTKFKREQDETVLKLSHRIVEMEHQMTKWLEQAPSTGNISSSTSSFNIAEEPVWEASASMRSEASVESSSTSPVPPPMPLSIIHEEILIPPTTIRGRYPELFDMHDKGKSVEQIAKALGMNKGEVQLILQLVRREEEYHA